MRPRVEPAAGVAPCVVQLLGPGEAALSSVPRLAAKTRGPWHLAPASQARRILRSASERTLFCRTARLALDGPQQASPGTIKSLSSILSKG
jgi:hypothetical protein